MNKNRINIIFDIGGVILNFYPHTFLDKYFPALHDKLYQIVFDSSSWKQLDLGYLTTGELKQVLINKHSHLEKEISFIMDHWEDEILQPIQETFRTIKLLKKNHFPIYILSNIHPDIYYRKTKEFDIFNLFNGYILSGEEHLLKPDHKLYQILFNRYHLDPKECLFIDDSPINIKAAQALGMQGIIKTKDMNLKEILKEKNIL
ncbi:HAD family hydrolase [Eggerthia catenaformis]|uniref:HAD family hydrolase n=1 Tax=Eggerthia catenaformis TaxID=31973 RepID=UPI003C6FF521